MANTIRVLGSNPDKVVFSDDDLIDHLGDLLNEENESVSYPWIAINRLYTLRSKLASWTGEQPEWLEHSMSESKWGSGHAWNGGKVAWLLGKDRMVIQCGYALTLADAVADLDSIYYHSSIVKGWIVKISDDDIERILDILATYDIEPSTKLKDYLDGRGTSTSSLIETVEEAHKAGFKHIKKFASGRQYKWWQEQSVVAMAYNGSTMLADQVGLGKGGSFVGGHLTLARYLDKNYPDTTYYPIIFSVTKTMKYEIAEEILKWKEDAQIQIVEGTKRDPLQPGMQFYILNHDILEKRLPDILEVEPVGFVADESHVFKNEDAKRTKAAMELAEYVRNNTEFPYIVMASGTPFVNGPIELWTILTILGKAKRFGDYARKKLKLEEVEVWVRVRGKLRKFTQPLSDKRAFEMYFCDGHYDKYKAWHTDGSSHTTELNRLLIASGMIRRRKSDVMSPLPPLNEEMIKIEPSHEFMSLYYQKEDEFRSWALRQAHILAEEEGISQERAMKLIAMKLDNGEAMMRLTELRKTLAFGKIDGTVEWIHRFMDGTQIVKHADGHMGPVSDDPDRKKLIVFVHHQEPRRQLVEHPDLVQYGVRTILAGSEQDGDSIQENKVDFQTDPTARLIICTMAAREGHTLTAAKDVLLMEIPFVPSWIVQMAGRCWARLSELYDPHDATLHYAIVDNTEDIKSLRRVHVKKAVFDAVIDAEGQDSTIDEAREEDMAAFLSLVDEGRAQLTIAR